MAGRRRKPSPSRRSSTSWIRKSTRFAIYARDNFDCWHCRQVFPPAEDGQGLTLDHITPRHQGGTDAPENLITACHGCNSTRQHAPLDAATERRLRQQASVTLNRELGRLYARLYVATRDATHPLTRREQIPAFQHAQSLRLDYGDPEETEWPK